MMSEFNYKLRAGSLVLGFAFVSIPVFAETIQTEKSIMTPDSLEQRGKQLRVAIEQAYKQLVDTKTLKPGGNNITEVVIKYIPVEASFDDAEQVLRSAGFKVEQRPGANPPSTRPEKYDVIAKIDLLDWKHFPSKASVWVFLSPLSPGSYDKVSKIHAGITLSSL